MKSLLVLSFILFISSQVYCFEYITIDSFATGQPPLVEVIDVVTTDDYDWWTIYYLSVDYVGPPAFAFHDTTDCLGGQRDALLGHEGATPIGSVSVISLVNNRASVAFPLNYAGGAYFQWDGDDAQGGATAFPGASLNILPGIGSTACTLCNGQSVDFTAGGNGIGVGITVSADLPVNYFIDALDSFGNQNTINFIHTPEGEDVDRRYFFRYTDPDWNNLAFNWGDVAAYQVRIFTFQGGANQAIDTDFFSLGVIGYAVGGNVFIDCGCVGSPLSFVNNEQIDLHLGPTPTTPVASTFTDINGNYGFSGLDDGTYTVCLNNLAQDLCTPVTGCITFSLANEVDRTDLDFSITTVSSLVPPPDVTIECGSCQTVQCLGSATATLCGSGSVPVTTFTDSPTIGGCTRSFQRTFSDNGQFATQTVTIVDTINPTITTPASPVSRACDNNQAESFNAWVANSAGATFSDCSSMTFSNNAGAGPGICGSVSVIFTATDICGNSASSSASYTTTDFQAPTFTTDPSDQTANCDAAGNSDFAAFNAWLNSNGGASVSDNCGSTQVTNNFVQGSLVRGCNSFVTVTFTATDSCSNQSQRTATFSIIDQSGPVINPQAQSPTVPCDNNSNSSFNAWLNNFGNALASDDCVDSSSLIYSNDFIGSPPFGCNDSRTVTFTVSDSCGQSATTTGVFTVVDNGNPTLTTPASSLNVDCDSGSGNELNNWLSDNGGARATDACFGSVSFTNDFTSLSGDCTQVPVTFTGCDGCGNCVATTATYSIVDTEAPFYVVAPSDLIVECGTDTQTSYDSWVASEGNASVSDNCATQQELTFVNDAPATAPVGGGCTNAQVVNFRVQDPCGNTTPINSASFIVNDSTSPSITVFPVDQTVDCDPSSNQQSYSTWLSTRGGAEAVDSCSQVVWSNDGSSTFSLANGDCFDSTTVTFTASDVCGNFVGVTASFSIIDNSPPTLVTPASDDSSECNSSAVNAWLADNGGARASDICSGVIFTNNFISFTGGCVETAFVTFTATDACGLAVDTSATYSITDTQPPIINPQAQSRNVPCDNNTQSELSNWLNTQGNADATDACQDDSTLIWNDDFNSAVVGCDFVDVVFTVTDACGNTATTSARFTSTDNDPPTFNPEAQNLTVECDGNGNTGDFNNWVTSRAGSVPQDECALSFTFSNNAPTNGPVGCGSQAVTFTVEDECGNTAATTAVFTVDDTQSPVFSTLPSDRTVECDGAGNTSTFNDWVTSNGGAVAVDTCASVVNFQQALDSTDGDSCSQVQHYRFTASDQCGNSAFQTASFTIHDFTSPAFTTDPSDVSFECDGNGNVGDITSWVNDNGGARASDLCQGPVTITNDFNGNGIFTCVSSLVTFTANDGCGNIAIDTATVTITDNTDPIFNFFPDDTTVPCDADITTDVLGFATAVDVCSGDLFVSMVETSFDEPPIGDCPGDHIITRTFAAFDDCGNSISRDQVITVVIQRSSGPCDPEGCECDGCCPPAAASDCLPVDCQAVSCNSSPCEAVQCNCGLLTESKSLTHIEHSIEDLPQCKPVYIYVNDDDDSVKDIDTNQISKQRMFVTNEPLHESILQSKTSSASSLLFSFTLLVLSVLMFI